MMEKERYCPIQMAFKVVDFAKLRNLLKEIGCFFSEEEMKRKCMLLEKRLTSRTGDHISEITFKRRISTDLCLETDESCGGETENYLKVNWAGSVDQADSVNALH